MSLVDDRSGSGGFIAWAYVGIGKWLQESCRRPVVKYCTHGLGLLIAVLGMVMVWSWYPPAVVFGLFIVCGGVWVFLIPFFPPDGQQ